MKPPLPRIETSVPRLPHVQLEIGKAIGTLMTPEDQPLRQGRAEIVALGRDLELLAGDIRKAFEEAVALVKAELRAALKKYSPDQPRISAGNTDGGRGRTAEANRRLIRHTPPAEYLQDAPKCLCSMPHWKIHQAMW
jgi:hypothetical protein